MEKVRLTEERGKEGNARGRKRRIGNGGGRRGSDCPALFPGAEAG